MAKYKNCDVVSALRIASSLELFTPGMNTKQMVLIVKSLPPEQTGQDADFFCALTEKSILNAKVGYNKLREDDIDEEFFCIADDIFPSAKEQRDRTHAAMDANKLALQQTTVAMLESSRDNRKAEQPVRGVEVTEELNGKNGKIRTKA